MPEKSLGVLLVLLIDPLPVIANSLSTPLYSENTTFGKERRESNLGKVHQTFT
jgi:hypothetical protein